MTTPDQLAAIEAAAKAEYEHEMLALDGSWADASKEARALFRQSATVALEAAYPALLAMVREQRAVIERVRSMVSTWEETSRTFGRGNQNVSTKFVVTRIRAAITATEGAA